MGVSRRAALAAVALALPAVARVDAPFILDGPQAFLAFLQEKHAVTSEIVRAANIRIQ